MAATDETRLMLRLEASSTKMQAEVRKASAVVAEAMRKIDAQAKAANRSVYTGIERSAKHLQDSAQNYKAAGFAAQNAAFQVGDFFTQVAGGTAPTRAMAQQLPQLLGSFGLIGALAGAAAAALVPLAGNLFAAAEKAQTVDEAMKGVSQSMSDYQRYIQVAAMSTAELTERFGAFAGQVQAFSEYMAGIALGETIDGLKGTVEALGAPLAEILKINEAANTASAALEKRQAALASGEGFQASVDSARRQLEKQQEAADKAAAAMGLTVDQAVRLNAAILAIGESQTMADMATSAAEVGAIFREIAPIGYELPEPLREAAGATEALMASAAEANVALSEMPGILTSVQSAAGGAAASFAALAAKAWEAAQGSMAALAAERQLDSMRMEFSPAGQALAKYGSRGTPSGTGAPAPASGGIGGRSGGGGGGGGGGSDIANEAKRIFDETRTAAEKYRVEEQRLGELLRMNAITQETYGRAIEGLRDKYKETGNSLQEFQDAFRSGFSDMISGVIDGSMKAEDAVKKMVTRLASILIENQIFSLLGNLMPNVFGASGFLPLTKSAMGNVIGGGRLQAFAAGGVVNGPTMFPMRGGTGLMGEAGPEAIMPLTRVNGKLGVQASGGSGGPRTVVQVINQGGGEVRQERQQGPGGEELIRITVGKQLARGDHDSAMKRYAARPAGVKR
ncbi:MAG: hypothetical protein O9289_06080 [Rhodobacteraceae bacterium]|nr:hypothetical protein [Paracoccaceae bacterium]MCZ8082755.1 hypothetical protein [Paracoccaceae bacterium]